MRRYIQLLDAKRRNRRRHRNRSRRRYQPNLHRSYNLRG